MIHHDSLSQMLIPQLSLPADELFDNILNLKSYKITAQTHIITTPYIVDHRRSQWSSGRMPDCSAWDPIALWAVVFIVKTTVIYKLGYGLRTLPAVPRSTQPSTLRGTINEYQLSS